MKTAFVLLKTNLEKEKSVLKALKRMTCVEDTQRVFGPYDIIVRVQAQDEKAVRDTVVPRLLKIDGVSSEALPLIVEEEVKVAEDVFARLTETVGETGIIQPVMGGYEITVKETEQFKWADVFEILLDFSYETWVSRKEKDLVIGSKPCV